jgi:hypothetical protein
MCCWLAQAGPQTLRVDTNDKGLRWAPIDCFGYATVIVC